MIGSLKWFDNWNPSGENDAELKLMAIEEIVGSVSKMSNTYNDNATKHVREYMLLSSSQQYSEVQRIQENMSSNTIDKFTVEWNNRALSRVETYHLLSNHNILAETLTKGIVFLLPTIVCLSTLLLHNYNNLLQTTYTKYIVLFFAIAISVIAIYGLIREGFIKVRNRIQRTLLFTAAFLLGYELLMLFSVVLKGIR